MTALFGKRLSTREKRPSERRHLGEQQEIADSSKPDAQAKPIGNRVFACASGFDLRYDNSCRSPD